MVSVGHLSNHIHFCVCAVIRILLNCVPNHMLVGVSTNPSESACADTQLSLNGSFLNPKNASTIAVP